MDLVFPAEHGLLTAGGLPVAESDTQLAHTRPEPFSIYAGLPRWLADGMSVGTPESFPRASACLPNCLSLKRNLTDCQRQTSQNPRVPVLISRTVTIDLLWEQ